MSELTQEQIACAKLVLEYAEIEPSDLNLKRYLEWGVVSFTEDERGQYCWYMDDDGNEICLNVATQEEIDTSEI